VPIFGLDALSSAAYGLEAALTVLLPLGAAGLAFILPITLAIVILLGIAFTKRSPPTSPTASGPCFDRARR
jgi:hypothetical protein